jgi:hypothetical protein
MRQVAKVANGIMRGNIVTRLGTIPLGGTGIAATGTVTNNYVSDFRHRNLGFCDFEVLAVLLRVEPGEEIVFLDLGPHIDGPLEDLAVDPKAEIGLGSGAESRR